MESKQNIKFWPMMVTVFLGSFVVMLDSSTVNIALPYLITNLNTNLDTAKWAITGFMLAMGTMAPLAAFLGEESANHFLSNDGSCIWLLSHPYRPSFEHALIWVSWALYSFLKQVDNSIALLGAWFRLIYCAILGASIMNLVYVLLILSGGNIPATQSNQLNMQVMLFIDAFNKMWSLGLIIFGIHLLIIGKLVLKSGFIPKILGILLLIAAVSYYI